MVSTFPPKLCGLATFAAALSNSLELEGHTVDVVRINDGDPGMSGIFHPIVAELLNGSPGSIRKAAMALRGCDAVIIQHEYGIYGGPDGEEIIEFMRALEILGVPMIVTLHTVPVKPTLRQHDLLVEIAERADGVVVMTESARARLIDSYPVDPLKITTIPHGAALPTDDPLAKPLHPTRRPELLTWGLLGPGKGIEHAIDALALIARCEPRSFRPRYTIAGVTHPKVLARDGDAYRHSLIQRSFAGGSASSVTFDDTYRDVPTLTRYVASCSVVVLPYDSRDQVTSGVLVDAIAAGRPVIATEFPHAVELLASGAGLTVPQGDAAALAEAIRSVLGDPGVLIGMEEEARRLAPSMSWATVANSYVRLSTELQIINEPVAI
jgi:polysaccharide biosynthesis protein PslF